MHFGSRRYYAHHACTRAKELCTPPTEDDSASTISSQSDESAIREALLNSYTQHARMPHSGVINTLVGSALGNLRSLSLTAMLSISCEGCCRERSAKSLPFIEGFFLSKT